METLDSRLPMSRLSTRRSDFTLVVKIVSSRRSRVQLVYTRCRQSRIQAISARDPAAENISLELALAG